MHFQFFELCSLFTKFGLRNCGHVYDIAFVLCRCGWLCSWIFKADLEKLMGFIFPRVDAVQLNAKDVVRSSLQSHPCNSMIGHTCLLDGLTSSAKAT